ncbi:3-oxoacyl-[acyl-carrier-protein] synthase, partial [Massospora cicadina]
MGAAGRTAVIILDKTDQIEMLKFENSQLRLELSKLKANSFRTRKPLEASPLESLDTMASRGSRIEEFETTFKERSEGFTTKAYFQEHDALNCWGKVFYRQDPSISPIHSAPIVYNFTMNDIGVASLYTAGITNLVCIKPEAQSTPKLEPSIYFNPL